jgi:uncharacterized protein YjiS (DUF1127 family)
MEMHSRQSLHEIHGFSALPRRRSRWGTMARRAVTQLLAVLKGMKAAIEAELAARRAIEELAGMNDYMLRDLGITRGEIESTVRRSCPSVGTDDGPVLSTDIDRHRPALPTVNSPYLAERRPERPEAVLRAEGRDPHVARKVSLS